MEYGLDPFLNLLLVSLNGPSTCLQFLVPVLDIIFTSPCSFSSFSCPTNPRETENSYFETQTQQIENITKPVPFKSLFTVCALVLNLLHILCQLDYPTWLYPIVLD